MAASGSLSSSGTEAGSMGDWRCSLRSADQPPDPYHHYDDDDHEGEADVVRHPEDHVVWHVAIAPSLIGSTQPEVTARKQSHVVHPALVRLGQVKYGLEQAEADAYSFRGRGVAPTAGASHAPQLVSTR